MVVASEDAPLPVEDDAAMAPICVAFAGPVQSPYWHSALLQAIGDSSVSKQHDVAPVSPALVEPSEHGPNVQVTSLQATSFCAASRQPEHAIELTPYRSEFRFQLVTKHCQCTTEWRLTAWFAHPLVA